MIEFATAGEYESERFIENSGIGEGGRTRAGKGHRAAQTFAVRGYWLCESGPSPRVAAGFCRSDPRKGQNAAAGRGDCKGDAAQERLTAQHSRDARGHEDLFGGEKDQRKNHARGKISSRFRSEEHTSEL